MVSSGPDQASVDDGLGMRTSRICNQDKLYDTFSMIFKLLKSLVVVWFINKSIYCLNF